MEPEPTVCQYPLKKIFNNLQPFLKNPPPLQQNPVQGLYEQFFDSLPDYQILVVGAGGLGCQIIKNLAVSGIRNIHLIDMDTIDLTNLNRQFLFRLKDVGRKKAEVVAQFVMKRCPGVKIIPHCQRVQQLQYEFYTKFGIIIGGLDNVAARKFLNSMVHQINRDQQQTCVYYIDGATEGFQGQCLVVQPFVTSCYNCSLLQGLGQKPKANYCTIANTPRTPQHCIQYVIEILWQKQFPDTKKDNDNLEHMQWVYQKSLQRAKQFNIEGVTEMLTLGVSKNIIPAIASTNALISAICTNQALKLIGGLNPRLKNYFIYRGGVSVGSDTYQLGKKQNCQVRLMRVNKLQTLTIEMSHQQLFIDVLEKISQRMPVVSQKPFVNIDGKIFYNPSDRARCKEKENYNLGQLQTKGILKSNPQLLVVSDKNLKEQLKVLLKIQ